MMKAGLIEEMMNDALDGVLDTEDMEEESEAQVEQVLAELALDTRAALPQAKVGGVCVSGPACSFCTPYQYRMPQFMNHDERV